MAQDEQITKQLVTSEETEGGTSEETLQDEGQSLHAEELNLIPEKFIGKSVSDVVQAYRELERDRGRIASELGEARKEREALEGKYRELETTSMRQQPMPTQTPPQQMVQSQETDPLSVFESKFDEDPKAAIREALKYQNEALQRRQQEQSVQYRSAEASDWFYQQKRENPDYARREPLMQQAAQQYAHIIKPEFLNSVEALKILDLVSRGMDVDHYAKQAVVKAQKDGLSVLEEKRRAQSETASSDGDNSKAFDSLTLEEMEKYLGEDDR